MKKLIQPISNIFHPLLSVSWASLLLLYFSPLRYLPSTFRLAMFLEVVFMTFLLPSILIIVLSKIGMVKNGVALRDRADRVFPLFVQLLLYVSLAFLLKMQNMPKWSLFIYYGASALAVVYSIVTIKWKISAHAGCNAALATIALIIYYNYPMMMPLFIPLFLIVMAGVVCSIRVYLKRHTMAQVGVGALVGTVLMAVSYLISINI